MADPVNVPALWRRVAGMAFEEVDCDAVRALIAVAEAAERWRRIYYAEVDFDEAEYAKTADELAAALAKLQWEGTTR